MGPSHIIGGHWGHPILGPTSGGNRKRRNFSHGKYSAGAYLSKGTTSVTNHLFVAHAETTTNFPGGGRGILFQSEEERPPLTKKGSAPPFFSVQQPTEDDHPRRVVYKHPPFFCSTPFLIKHRGVRACSRTQQVQPQIQTCRRTSSTRRTTSQRATDA